jgi:hypothetical protein
LTDIPVGYASARVRHACAVLARQVRFASEAVDIPAGVTTGRCRDVGKSLGVVSDAAFSPVVVMVMLTTLVTPPVLAHLLRDRTRTAERTAARRIAGQST